jgi:hypothetical protein
MVDKVVVEAAIEAATAAGVLLSPVVTSELQKLPEDQRATIAVAIGQISPDAGERVRFRSPRTGEQYRAIVPASPDAPVVSYRPLKPDDGHGTGFLVTGLIDRSTWDGYKLADETGVLDSRLGRLVTDR